MVKIRDADLLISTYFYSWYVQNVSLRAIARLQSKRAVVCVTAPVSPLIIWIKTCKQRVCVCMCVLQMVKMFPCAARLPVSPLVWRTLWIIFLPTSRSLPSLSLSLGLSDTFPLSSVPLRGSVTQQSLNHRFEVSLLCLETYKNGEKGKVTPTQDLWVNAVLNYQEAPPVVCVLHH